MLPIWQLSTDDAELLTTAAEKLGFDAVLIPDHILAPPATLEHYGPIWPDIFTLLGYLAGRTSRILLGSSVVVVPYRNPAVVAECVATVDQVSCFDIFSRPTPAAMAHLMERFMAEVRPRLN